MDAAERQPETADRAIEETTATAETCVRRRWRFQYSLATLMWLSTVAVCACALVVTYRRMERAETEVGQYRDEMGYLDISNRSKASARMIRQVDPNRWTWRVYLPPGRHFRFRMATEQIPAQGLPERQGDMSPAQSEGEQLVDLETVEELGGRLRVTLYHTGSRSTIRLPIASWDWEGVSWTQESAVPGAPLVLLRRAP